MTLNQLVKTLRLSLLSPRDGMRAVLELRLTLQDSVMALALTAYATYAVKASAISPAGESAPVQSAIR